MRRHHRELHAARHGQLRPHVGDDPRDQPALHPGAHACVRVCPGRGATTPASRRPWNRSPGWRGSPGIVGPAAHPTRSERPQRRDARGVRLDRRARERDATGRGHHFEVTMVEGALNAAAEIVLEYTAYGNRSNATATARRTPRPKASTRARRETWLAISVETDEQWQALAARSRQWDEPAFDASPGRRAAQDHSTSFSANREARDVAEAAALLMHMVYPRPLGSIPGSPRTSPTRCPQVLRVARSLRRRPPALPTAPFRFASVDRWLLAPAPLLGQHNDDILRASSACQIPTSFNSKGKGSLVPARKASDTLVANFRGSSLLFAAPGGWRALTVSPLSIPAPCQCYRCTGTNVPQHNRQPDPLKRSMRVHEQLPRHRRRHIVWRTGARSGAASGGLRGGRAGRTAMGHAHTAAAAALGITGAYTSLDDTLAKHKCEAVTVSTPPFAHLDPTLQAIAAATARATARCLKGR